MSDVVFNDKSTQPTDQTLADKLGNTFPYWQEIKQYTTELVGDTTEEWKFYGRKYGWQLKTLLKKRNLFFLIPYDFNFKIVLIFGDKAVAEIERSTISNDIKNDIINAKKYMEGRGIGIDVRDGEFIEDIKQLIKIKVDF
jgi:hypothetical protein